MIKFDPLQKQAFLMILSFLEFSDLFVVARVCKYFYFLLYEEEKFWKFFYEKHFSNMKELPKEIPSWKILTINRFNLIWDDSRFEGTSFQVEEEKRLLKRNATTSWQAALSVGSMKEGVMYGVEIEDLSEYFFNSICKNNFSNNHFQDTI